MLSKAFLKPNKPVGEQVTTFLHFTNSLKLKLLASTKKDNLLIQRTAKPSDPYQSTAMNYQFSHNQGTTPNSSLCCPVCCRCSPAWHHAAQYKSGYPTKNPTINKSAQRAMLSSTISLCCQLSLDTLLQS